MAPAIVFVTAYDEHAVRAFGVSAVDYLLKPVAPERLENGDVLIRRKADAPPPPPLGESLGGPGDAAPALPDIPINPDQPEIPL